MSFNKTRKRPARTYIKHGTWHLGGRRKNQKGRCLPIFGAIAKPSLLSVATGIGGYALKILRKLLGGIRRVSHRQRGINHWYA